MEERTARVLGALSALGGVLASVATVPSEWYGVAPTDAHVFDPPAFSPMWIERTVVPTVAVLAGALLVLGAAALVVRDRAVAGRLRRWSGYAAVGGLGLFELGLVVSVASGPGIVSAGGTVGPLVVVVAILLLFAGLGLGIPALVATGVGYARTDRPTVGHALVVGPLLSILVLAGPWIGVVGSLGRASWPAAVVPVGAAFVAVGYELWTHPEPLGEGGWDETTARRRTAGGVERRAGLDDAGADPPGRNDGTDVPDPDSQDDASTDAPGQNDQGDVETDATDPDDVDDAETDTQDPNDLDDADETTEST